MRKHHVGRRLTRRKLHLGIEERTKEMVAVELTASRVHDSQQLPSLVAQIPNPISQVSGDGAYDIRACYEAVLRGIDFRSSRRSWLRTWPIEGRKR